MGKHKNPISSERIRLIFIIMLFLIMIGYNCSSNSAPHATRKISGYRGIWFTLGQFSGYGDKYSGGLGTYTAKHHPLAIYAPEVNQTFFVYGGTTKADERHLLAMVSYYDHQRHLVPRPTVVHDKQGVNDPHDNPSLCIDEYGYLWVFVSGRARKRPGFIYRSLKPYDIEAFELIKKDEFTYPQPWWHPGKGFLLLFTRYTKGRELYWATSKDGRTWSDAQKLVEGGHYQMSNQSGNRVITAFNSHPSDGNVDGRTNLYFLQTNDMGKTWQTADGTVIEIPLKSFDNPAIVRDYLTEKRLVYLKDIGFDLEGNPVLLTITSGYHQSGPKAEPRVWTIAHYKENEWTFHEMTNATHNYDMGSLYIEADGTWRIIAPTEPGPQYYGTGGEIAVWTSHDQGKSWKKLSDVTQHSERNHGYARRPVSAHPDFYAFWADGNPDSLSISRLYFTNQNVEKLWILPYEMKSDYSMPERLGKENH